MNEITQFRTKGKGSTRNVYPLGQKRKAYGIPRNVAAEDVQQLRAKGEKARLIKTNTRLGLYAPYVSDLEFTSTEPAEPEKKEAASEKGENSNNMPSVDVTTIDKMEQAKDKFKMGDIKIENIDGKSFVDIVDRNGIFDVWMELDKPLTEKEMDKFDGNRHPIHKHVHLGNDTVVMDLNPEERKEIETTIKSLTKEMIHDEKTHEFPLADASHDSLRVGFIKQDNSDYGYIGVYAPSIDTDEKEYGKVIRVKMHGPQKDFTSTYQASLFMKSLKVYDSITSNGKKSSNHYFATIPQSDYPITISKSKPGNDNLLPSGVMLAPLADSRLDKSQLRILVHNAAGTKE